MKKFTTILDDVEPLAGDEKSELERKDAIYRIRMEFLANLALAYTAGQITFEKTCHYAAGLIADYPQKLRQRLLGELLETLLRNRPKVVRKKGNPGLPDFIRQQGCRLVALAAEQGHSLVRGEGAYKIALELMKDIGIPVTTARLEHWYHEPNH
jgi:hypothetical protein